MRTGKRILKYEQRQNGSVEANLLMRTQTREFLREMVKLGHLVNFTEDKRPDGSEFFLVGADQECIAELARMDRICAS